MIIETKNLRVIFNKKNLEIYNVFYKNEEIIKSISFFDDFFNELSQLATDHKYIKPVSKIIKELDWDFDYKSKKKENIVFASGKYKKEKLVINLNITFIVKENQIIIKFLNNSNKKIFYGISTKLISIDNGIKLPYELKGTNFIQIGYEDYVSFKSENFICKISSTFLNVKQENNKQVIFTPIIFDTPRKVLKSWKISNNNKNFNAINLKFSNK